MPTEQQQGPPANSYTPQGWALAGAGGPIATLIYAILHSRRGTQWRANVNQRISNFGQGLLDRFRGNNSTALGAFGPTSNQYAGSTAPRGTWTTPGAPAPSYNGTTPTYVYPSENDPNFMGPPEGYQPGRGQGMTRAPGSQGNRNAGFGGAFAPFSGASLLAGRVHRSTRPQPTPEPEDLDET